MKIKTFFILSSFLFISISSFSQDTIINKDGESIIAKVIEIRANEIGYKKFSFQDGPTYVINKSDIIIIKFANGVKEHFDNAAPIQPTYVDKNTSVVADGQTLPYSTKITPFGETRWHYNNQLYFEKPIIGIMLQRNDPEINKLIVLANGKKKQQYIGFASIPLAIIAIGVASAAGSNGINANDQVVYGTIGGLIGGAAIGALVYDMVVSQQRKAYVHKAIRIYNDKY